MRGSEALKTYRVALGGQPVGAKDRQGDHKTPEGIYEVDSKKPNSQFHRALHESRIRVQSIGSERGNWECVGR